MPSYTKRKIRTLWIKYQLKIRRNKMCDTFMTDNMI